MIFTSILFVVAFISTYFHIEYVTGKIFAYTSPLVIITSVSFLLIFVRLDECHFHSYYVNKIATSCFAVFLLHTNPNIIIDYYCTICLKIYYKYSPVEVFLLTTSFMIIVFVIAIIADQLRIWCWNRIDRNYFSKKINHIIHSKDDRYY